jgi:galactose mutarotase-like enzyme
MKSTTGSTGATTTAEFGGERTFVLADESGARAWVVPGIGNNCIAFQVPVAGKTAHLLSTPPSVETLRQRPTGWGYPILSPYPGRHQTPFTWRGRRHEIFPSDRPGVAIHGIAQWAPWEVLDAAAGRITCRFDSEAFPDRQARWPWPFTLTTTHRLEGGRLTLDLALENRADEEVPHLLGLHPYLPVRLTPSQGTDLAAPFPTAAEIASSEASAARDSCVLWVAGDELWQMKAGLGTGEILRLEGAWDLRRPKPVAELERTIGTPAGAGLFGHHPAPRGPRLPVLLYGKRAALRAQAAGTDPTEDGGVYSGLQDHASGVEVTLATSVGFGSLAVYCPPGQPFVSLEPRSAVSDALTLMNDARRLSTGVWPLAPGATWKAWAQLWAAPLRGSHVPSGARVIGAE